ncbi:unnamed protein product [Brassicogethes aeneus]|uniref:Protein THEM6 n=1 Tax=Brassicogethes aeneus TaxID=1431903 RepID=A0A9P0FN13_BRAAE|nr:unnamed protein product [Brassicogethes aeneus]
MTTWILYLFLCILCFLLTLYLVLELHYFIRSFWCILFAKIVRKKVHILEETKIRGICIPTDIDTLLTHMNNARFMRELDFAKLDFYQRTGLWQCIRKNNGGLAVAATTIRYRRFIKLFTRYYITTKVIYWDDKSIYMEHKFISYFDKFINAIAFCKVRIIDCDSENILTQLMSTNIPENPTKEKPDIPPDLKKWIEYIELSSAHLRTQPVAVE